MKCANDQAMKKYFTPLLLLFLLVTQISCVPGAYRTPWDSPSAQTGKAAQAPHVLLNSGTYATVEPQQDSYLTEAAAQANTDQVNTHIETAEAPAAQQGSQDTTATAPQDQGSADDIVVAQSYRKPFTQSRMQNKTNRPTHKVAHQTVTDSKNKMQWPHRLLSHHLPGATHRSQ